MSPRLATSKKWTSFPPELLEQIRQIFAQGFTAQTAKGEILVEGRIYPEELLLRVGYLETGRLAQANFEVSLDFNMAKQNALEQVHFAIDCAASMMEVYFQSDENLSEFPRVWTPHEIGGRQVFLQVSGENSKLEAEANRILDGDDEGLVKGSDEDEVRARVQEMLGISDDSDDGGGGDDDGHGVH